MMRKNRIGLSFILLAAIILVGAFSCKKYYDPPPVFEKYGQDSTELQRKVLIISIDGVSGRALKEINPPNIARLMQHGKYSYSVMPSLVSTDASTWVTLLSGVSYEQHQIADSSFIVNLSGGSTEENEDKEIKNYPPIFTYLPPLKPRLKIAAITPWEGLSDYLGLLDMSIAVNNDEAVKDTAVSILKNLSPLGIMLVDLNEADVAGKKGLPSLADSDYRNAIIDADKKIGDIITALHSRKNFENEDWLIMVTTNRAGTVNSPKAGFVVLSNPSLQKEEVKKVGLNSITMKGSDDNAIYATMNPVVDGKRVYDFQKDFTIQFDAHFTGNKEGSYPNFFGNKSALNGGSDPGFSFLIDYDPTWTFNTTSGSKFQVKTDTKTLFDGEWHTMGITVENNGGTRTVSTYLDGEFKAKGDLPSGANLNSSYPLSLGLVTSGDIAEASFHNIKLFDIALDSSDMEANECAKSMGDLNDEDDLVGFWSCDEGGGSIFFNSVAGNPPFIVHGDFNWERMDAVPCSVDAVDTLKRSTVSVVPFNGDIMANMLYWLNIKPKSDWELGGSAWLDNYEDEIYDL